MADTLTASQYVYIGDHARLVATSDGMRIEILNDTTGNWVDHGEFSAP